MESDRIFSEYALRCDVCRHRWYALVADDTDPLSLDCPECGSFSIEYDEDAAGSSFDDTTPVD